MIWQYCWHRHKDGYLRTCIGYKENGGNIYKLMHVMIMEAEGYTCAKDEEVDHINGKPNDNRIENLRDVTQAENNRNSSKRKDNSTGHAGVWLNKLNPKKKFMAELSLLGKRVHYSSHYTLEEAIAARKSAEQIYGFHPNHGMDKPAESSTTI